MSDEISSTSGYVVIDDNTTADDDDLDLFMSEAQSYTIYKIGEFTLFIRQQSLYENKGLKLLNHIDFETKLDLYSCRYRQKTLI